MGIALAEAFAESGAEVVLVKGPTHLSSHHPSIREVPVQTAAEMYEACRQYFDRCNVVVFAAAVADYTPLHPSAQKIKKDNGNWLLELTRTTDIAATLGRMKKPGQVIVGFALETENEMQHAKQKLEKKNFDMIVLNSLNDEGAGFQHDTNKINVIDKAGFVKAFPLKQKRELAQDLVLIIKKRMEEGLDK